MNVELKEKELLANQLEKAFFQTFVECKDVDSHNNETSVFIGKSEEEILGEVFFQTFVESEDVNSYGDEKPVYIGKLEY